MKKIILSSLILIILSLFSCKNDDWNFPDNAYSTVYFSYQYPVRTLMMGEDENWNTDLDNLHKCKIMGTWGGGYSNPKDVTIDFAVDESLCNNLVFKNNSAKVIPMPAEYYSLSSNKIIISKGAVAGGVEVQLTDAFFSDPLALTRNYVIPMVMVKAYNVDSILRGKTDNPNPNRCVSGDWSILPKDYILYAVKYINEWDGNYLRRGKDVVTKDGKSETIIRRTKYVEDNSVSKLNTKSLSKLEFPLTYKDDSGNNIAVSLLLNFDDKGKCSVISSTNNVKASGNGEFVKKGEKKSWGNKDRNALYLDYTVTIGSTTYATKDTLVVKDRGIAPEYFEVSLKQ